MNHFVPMCVRLFRHPAESISLGQIIWEGVLPAEFFMAQRHPFMRLFLPFLLYLLSERQLVLQQHIVDRILMKITLVFQAFPNFILAVAVAGMLGTGLKNSVLALGAVYWITYAKLSRSLVLSIRDSEYIRAAKICGAGPTALIFKYILPNMVSPLIVTAALDVSSFILSMAGLSFLGLGPSRPTAEWGATMSEAKTFIQQAPWCIVFPGLALLVTVVIFNLLGDALRDVIDEG